MTGGDLDIPEVDACVEHCGDEGVAEHVRVCPSGLDAGGFGKLAQPTGSRVPIHPGTMVVEQDRPVRAACDRPVDGPADGWRQRDQVDLGTLPHTRSTRWPCSSPRSVMSVLVASKIRRPSIATSAKSHGCGDWRAAVSRASNCRWVKPRVGDSAGTAGRRTCSAGECSRTPSMAQVR